MLNFLGCSLGLIFSLAILLLLLTAIGSIIINQATFVLRAATTFVKGTITAIDSSCMATVTFPTHQNRNVEIQYGLGSWESSTLTQSSISCNGRVGDVVNVAYHTANPNEARVVPRGGFLLGNWLLYFAFIFVVLAGALGLSPWGELLTCFTRTH